MFARHSDPLAGWKVDLDHDPDQAILNDYQAYINDLAPKLKNGVGPMQYLEDGSGQHAILIAIAQNGTDWGHVLIYDKNNKRIKIIKYVMGHYRS